MKFSIRFYCTAAFMASTFIIASACGNNDAQPKDKEKPETETPSHKNPVLPGFFADPEILYSEATGKYYIYPTGDWKRYPVYSSDNLRDWKFESDILDLSTDQVSWALEDAWAPAIIERKIDGKYKYFFYFCGLPLNRGPKEIGVAIGETPTGPFTDSGQSIIKESPIGGGQQIDVDVFQDPLSGKYYLYWGNGYMAGAELEDNMISLKKETLTVMTPQGGTLEDYAYREAPYVFYRKGHYYFLWSVDDTGSANYHVAYGTSKSPLGPIKVAKQPVILRQRPDQGIFGPAHCAVLQVPDSDEWYIVYHRINEEHLHGDTYGHREVCIDRMEFNEDGTIKEVVPTK